MKKRYNPLIHNRKRLRLKGYDYSQPGYYFVTLCCNYKQRLFGEIENQKMILNEPGEMIKRWYYELENKFNHVKCHDMIIMPDHMHFILEITDLNYSNDRRVEPVYSTDKFMGDENNLKHRRVEPVCSTDKFMGDELFMRGDDNVGGDTKVAPYVGNQYELKHCMVEHIGSTIQCSTDIIKFNSTNKKSLMDIMQWFKTMTTNEYIRGIKTFNWQPFEKKLWLRSYFDSIIKKENYWQIAAYIRNNPKRWNKD